MIDISKLSYSVYLLRETGEQLDITNLSENLSWEENDGELAMHVSLSLANVMYNGQLISSVVKPNCQIIVTAQVESDVREVARARITKWEPTRSGSEDKLSMRGYDELFDLQHYMFAYGVYLDYHAEQYTLKRRGAVAASGSLTITGEPGTLIPEGFLFAVPATGISSAIVFKTDKTVTIDNNGGASVPVTCEQSGSIGNVAADTIVIMVSPMLGVNSITNENPMTGGAAEEDDESLRERIREYLKTVNVSFSGCDSDYKRWAMELDDVGGTVIIPEWAGPGTVKIVVYDRNYEPANSNIIDRVYEHIVSPDDRSKRLAPIGATVTVVAPTIKNISVSCYLTLETDAIRETVEESLRNAITAYMQSGISAVRIAKTGSIILGADGVSDYANLTINGGQSNISVGADEYPVLLNLVTDYNGEE